MRDNLKAGTRLLSAFLAVAILGAAVAVVGIINLAIMNEHAGRAYDQELPGLSHAKEANMNLISIGRAARGVLVATTPGQARRFGEQVGKGRRQLHENLEKARPRYALESGKMLLASVERSLADYEGMLPELMALAQDLTPAGRALAAEFALGPLAAKAGIVDEQLAALAARKENMSAAMAAASDRHYRSSQALMVALALASLAAGVGLGLWITRGLTRQPGAEAACALQVAAALAAGEWSTVIQPRPGEHVCGIAPANMEQGTGKEQAGMAIARIDQVTLENAALVEQAATAAGAMQERAAHLAHVVSMFKLGNEYTARAAIPAPVLTP
ncbi:MCP four helix bundle domain-containing protein [Massilia sp. DJPM01]|uniref:MCP four helix bundle domain-containing protein n=1 Tax=Massilia sp. DJPM01 TaxID=3024404 RepID=UPI00259E9DC1|nr:MCP four helix bundle domain-containing protein [Massilia sp. DJPM01]MDM5179491.1 MCP four helix bundle domain-containing protein [Massilia sp. DJPM01]